MSEQVKRFILDTVDETVDVSGVSVEEAEQFPIRAQMTESKVGAWMRYADHIAKLAATEATLEAITGDFNDMAREVAELRTGIIEVLDGKVPAAAMAHQLIPLLKDHVATLTAALRDTEERLNLTIEGRDDYSKEIGKLITKLQTAEQRLKKATSLVRTYLSSPDPTLYDLEDAIKQLAQGRLTAMGNCETLEQEVERLKGELFQVDEALARRDALDNLPNRYTKIAHACSVAAKADALERAITHTRGAAWREAVEQCHGWLLQHGFHRHHADCLREDVTRHVGLPSGNTSPWSSTRPTVAGWYWWRNGELNGIHHIAFDGGLYCSTSEEDIDEMGGEWSGPLLLPRNP